MKPIGHTVQSESVYFLVFREQKKSPSNRRRGRFLCVFFFGEFARERVTKRFRFFVVVHSVRVQWYLRLPLVQFDETSDVFSPLLHCRHSSRLVLQRWLNATSSRKSHLFVRICKLQNDRVVSFIIVFMICFIFYALFYVIRSSFLSYDIVHIRSECVCFKNGPIPN